MNYDHVGYLIKNYLWGVNELPSTILRHKFSLINKKIKHRKKTKNRTKTRKTQKINFNDCIFYQL